MRSLRLASLACALALLGGCQKGVETPIGEDLPGLVADRVMYGVDFFSNADGVKRSRTHADTAYVFDRRDSAQLQLRVLNVQMFDESGAKAGTITSRTGVINTRTKAMVARGNVVLVTNKQGKTIQTEELHYDPNSHRVWSDVRTVIIDRDGSKQVTETFATDDKFSSISGRGFRGAIKGVTF